MAYEPLLVRCIGCLFGIGAVVSYFTTLLTNNWVISSDGSHTGMFNHCVRKHNPNGTNISKIYCEEIGMDLPAWLHFARAFAIMTSILYGSMTLLGTLKCKIEGTTFKQKHFGEMGYLVGVCFAWLSHSTFRAFWDDSDLYKGGWLGNTYYTALLSSCLMPVAVILMMFPTLNSKWQYYRGKRVKLKTIRKNINSATNSAYTTQTSIGNVDRFGNLTRMHPLPAAAGLDTRARSPAQMSNILDEDSHFVNIFPTVEDILYTARQNGPSSPSSASQIYSIPADPSDTVHCATDDQSAF